MNKRADGIVFNIQRFCITDGDGIRTTVFLKGCPLRCAWCHNPESNTFAPQLLFKSSRCVGCRACEDACKNGVHRFINGLHAVDFDLCKKCGECMSVCCYDAVEICGKRMSVDEVVEQIMIDESFYGEKGGVTISGGEPLSQPDFLLELVKTLKEKSISVYLESSGYADISVLKRIQPYIDCFLFDWKLTDPGLHKKYVGVDNIKIRENLCWLDSVGAKIVLRCPIVPTVNDTQEHFEGIARLKRTLPSIDHVELMAYHLMGEGKKAQIGRDDYFKIEVPDDSAKKSWLERLKSLGCEAKLG